MNAKIVIVLAALAAVQAGPFTSLFNIPGQVMDSTSKALTSMAQGNIASTIDNFAKIPIEATQAAGKAAGLESQFKSGTDMASSIVNTVSTSFPGSADSKLNLPTSGFSFGSFLDIPKVTMGKVGEALNSFSTGNPSEIMKAFVDIPLTTVDTVGKSIGMEKQFGIGTGFANDIVKGVSNKMDGFNLFGNLKDITKNVPGLDMLSGDKSAFSGFTDFTKNIPGLDMLSGDKSAFSGFTDFTKNIPGLNMLSGDKSPFSGFTDKITGAKNQVSEIFGGVLNQDQLQKVIEGKMPDVNGLKEKLQGFGNQIPNIEQLGGKISDAVQNLGQFEVQAIRDNAGNMANEILSKLQQIPIESQQLGQMQQKVIDLARQIQTTTDPEQFGQLTAQVQKIREDVEQKVQQTVRQHVGTFNQQFNDAIPDIKNKLASIQNKMNPEGFDQLQGAIGETFKTIQENVSQVATQEQFQQLQAFAESRFGEINDVISKIASQN